MVYPTVAITIITLTTADGYSPAAKSVGGSKLINRDEIPRRDSGDALVRNAKFSCRLHRVRPV